ncbi:MAG: hypothetical protein DRG82_17190, partial [Deltaproteobacteria bacterium]
AECGGISVFAHPSLQEFESMACALRRMGLMGAEVYSPRLTPAESRTLELKAGELGLVTSGGSDWHYDSGRCKLGDFYLDTGQIHAFLDLAGVPLNNGT